MAFDPGLIQGDILAHKEVYQKFKVGASGGIRPNNEHKVLVIICDHTKGLYADKWDGDELQYTGMGPVGDQSKTYKHNRTLLESPNNGWELHLFEVFEKNRYIYQGEVYLSREPYDDKQYDNNNKERLVWMFPLKLRNGVPIEVGEYVIKNLEKRQLKEVRKLSKEKLKEMAEARKPKPASQRTVSTINYYRNADVVLYALERAVGICQLCEHPAPFNRKDGTPFLEVHHVEYLANGGTDTVDNVVALCPNCHRKIHALERRTDIVKLSKAAQERLV